MKTVSLILLTLCALASPWRRATAQDYVLTTEDAAKRTQSPDSEDVHALLTHPGKLEIIRVPVEDVDHAVIISTHPEVADVHVENPGLLFVVGRRPGQSIVVLTDGDKTPTYTTTVTVVAPVEEPHGG